MSTAPATQQGRRLREARLLAGLTLNEAADRVGMGRSEYGNIERGRQPRDPNDYYGEPARVALACAALGIAADEVEAEQWRNGQEIAAILRKGVATRQAVGSRLERVRLSVVPDALTDSVIDAFIAAVPEEHHRQVLWWRWRETDAENNLKPRDERLRALVDWVENYMPRPEGVPSSAEARGNSSGKVS